MTISWRRGSAGIVADWSAVLVCVVRTLGLHRSRVSIAIVGSRPLRRALSSITCHLWNGRVWSTDHW